MVLTALQAKELTKEELMKIPGVTGVGVSAGSAERINIYVKEFSPELEGKLPKQLDGVETRIIETGEITALPLLQGQELQALDANRLVAYRPIPGGTSIGQLGISAGTAGVAVRDNVTGRMGILSNAHVLVDYPPSAIMADPRVSQPGVHDGGGVDYVVGNTVRWIPLDPFGTNTVDCALMLPDNPEDISSEILDIGFVTGTQAPVQDMVVMKSGRSSGYTEATIIDINADIKVGYKEFTAQFTNQIISTPFGIPGDSISYDSRLYWKENGKFIFGTIEELYNSHKEGKSIEVLSIKKNNGEFPSLIKSEIIWNKVIDAIYHDIKPVYQITLHNGKTIKITKDHSLFSVKSFTSIMVPETLDNIESVASVDSYGFETDDIDIDDDMLAFLGLWMADGCYMKKDGRIDGVMISTGGDKKIIEFLKKFIEKFRVKPKANQIADEFIKNPNVARKEISEKYNYDLPTVYKIRQSVIDGKRDFKKITKSISHKSKGDYRLMSSELAKIIFDTFGDVISHTKRVPRDIFLASNRQIGLFLKGYYSGDGSAHTGQRITVECASVNRKLLEDVQVLLDRLDIRGNLTSGYIPIRFSKLRQYKLKTEGKEHIETFFEKIGMIKDVKMEFFNDLKNANYRIKRPISKRGIRKMEYIGMEKVYDLKVDSSESFVSNGFLCHNSGSLVLNKANKRAVGLLFAGSSNITIFTPINEVMSKLNVSIAGSMGTVSEAGGFIMLPLVVAGLYTMLKGGFKW